MPVTVTTMGVPGITSGGRNELVWGARLVGLYRVQLSSSYPTGGESFDPRSYGFPSPVASLNLSVRHVGAGTLTRQFVYDYVNRKILAATTSSGAEVANGTNLSAIVLDVIVLGE